ncbi:MAG TPA: sigma factor-like helix-turn-helix DNA-binding protein [Lactovum miscens]|uniref:YlxM family DNA-binding protein n=1 Tax=Lactovum miscens TaxID=190387 RepID=UPI002EDA322B
MTLEKTNFINNLLDFYEELLNEKQQAALSMYYAEDFSLSEIAENMDMTKQAASDLIKRSEKKLENFEEKLQLSKSEQARNEEISNLINKYHTYPELCSDLEKLKEL